MVSNILEFTSIQHSIPTVSLHDGILIEDGTYKIHEDYMFLMNSIGADVHSEMYDFFFTNEEYLCYPFNIITPKEWGTEFMYD